MAVTPAADRGVAEPVTAVVTLCSAARLDHVRNQQRLLARWAPSARRVVVWLDESRAPVFPGASVVGTAPGAHGFRLAAGRNAGASAALELGADLLVFLDADCVPGPALVATYARAAAAHPDALLCGPVTYLPESFALGGGSGRGGNGRGPSAYDEGDALAEATHPHPARPAPATGVTVVAAPAQYALFWSLSFAATRVAWLRVGGFDEAFEGYGGEDTDYAFRARAAGAPLVWVGGADAYHQYHPTSSPPWQHLDDIVRNGRLFAERWAVWPMEGWFRAFAQSGAVVRSADGGWVRADGATSEMGPATNENLSRSSTA